MPSVWVFAYGSLLFRPGFSHRAVRRATALGRARRFYQGSPDHRGTPDLLGRVVTLVEQPGGRCEGLAYELPSETRETILRELDLREKGGYERTVLSLWSGDGEPLEAVTWIAGANNPYWLGPEPLDAMVDRIARAHGPSGENRDYVLSLHRELERLGIEDAHVRELATLLTGP